MGNFRIDRYTVLDNKDALALEEQCSQGTSFVIKFRRRTFHTRSEVYDNYRILCARSDSKLIGMVAGTRKSVRLHDQTIQAAYVYDLRVHPDYRNQGVGKRLASSLLSEIEPGTHCAYIFVSGENRIALKMAQERFGAQVVVPLTYAILPVYKSFEEIVSFRDAGVLEVNEAFLRLNRGIEFVSPLDESRLLGYVKSVILDSGMAGCSIWSNENLLAEEVVKLPAYFRLMKIAGSLFGPFLKVPSIPGPSESIPSWHLFDVFARDADHLHRLCKAVVNYALSQDRTVLYLLRQRNDPLFTWLKHSGLKMFTFPYFFLARGDMMPRGTDRIYIDVRDL